MSQFFTESGKPKLIVEPENNNDGVDLAARAIFGVVGLRNVNWGNLNQTVREVYRDAARAAIEAHKATS